MVSSSVYGNEQLLNRVYATLSADYEVWMSHKGTVPLTRRASALQSCLNAVDNCDVFVGIITGRYGSGRAKGQPSITHREMRRAVELDKLCYCLVHHHVELARQVLRPYRLPPTEGPFRRDEHGTLTPIAWPKGNSVLSDLEVLTMYEEMMREEVYFEERVDNWVQKYTDDAEAITFLSAQLSDTDRVRQQLVETAKPKPNPKPTKPGS